MNHKDVFNDIYLTKRWGEGSGAGSTVKNTVRYRWFVQNFLRSNGIKSVVDIGCGDWQFSRLIDWSGVHYQGLDVSDVVLANTRKFAAEGIEFHELDALHDELPKADLVLIKDVFQHWNNQDVLKFLPKLTNFRTALITNGFAPNRRHALNLNVKTGGQRPIDLGGPPFNVNGNYVFWYMGDEPKYIFCWNRT